MGPTHIGVYWSPLKAADGETFGHQFEFHFGEKASFRMARPSHSRSPALSKKMRLIKLLRLSQKQREEMRKLISVPSTELIGMEPGDTYIGNILYGTKTSGRNRIASGTSYYPKERFGPRKLVGLPFKLEKAAVEKLKRLGVTHLTNPPVSSRRISDLRQRQLGRMGLEAGKVYRIDFVLKNLSVHVK